MKLQIFSNFWPIFFSTAAFLSSSVDPPFKESTDHGLNILKQVQQTIQFGPNKQIDMLMKQGSLFSVTDGSGYLSGLPNNQLDLNILEYS